MKSNLLGYLYFLSLMPNNKFFEKRFIIYFKISNLWLKGPFSLNFSSGIIEVLWDLFHDAKFELSKRCYSNIPYIP